MISSDAHAVNEIGRDEAIRSILKELNFPRNLIINRDEASAYAFIEERRYLKQLDTHGEMIDIRNAAG